MAIVQSGPAMMDGVKTNVSLLLSNEGKGSFENEMESMKDDINSS